jgi:hypothetical protein
MTHRWSAGHRSKHPPQFLGSLRIDVSQLLVRLPSQLAKPGVQHRPLIMKQQAPLIHPRILPIQATPHRPQFMGSVCVSTHLEAVEHHRYIDAQVSQRPSTHATPDGQLLPQVPQLAASLRDLSHPFSLRPSQSPNPSRHPTSEQTPASEQFVRALGKAHRAHGPASFCSRSPDGGTSTATSTDVIRSSATPESIGATTSGGPTSGTPVSGATHSHTRLPPTQASTPCVTVGPVRHPHDSPPLLRLA